jgi:hypothetical protein
MAPHTAEAGDARGSDQSGRAADDPLSRESVDFALRRAARGKMQLWLTAFTAAAALAVLAVVSVSLTHGG